LYKNGGLSVISSVGETEEQGGWGKTVMLILGKKKFLVKKEVFVGALS
jgi:hypothetical protein